MRRDYSQQEIRQKLQQKGYPKSDIQEIITELIHMGLLNEARFAENYVHFRQAKGYGPLRISMELKARGIPDEMIAEQLKITDNAWLIHAQRVSQKRFKLHTASVSQRAKQIRFLQYRGFTREQIHYALGLNEEENS